MTALNVQIPESHRGPLRRWLELSDAEAARVKSAVEKAAPRTTSVQFAKQLAAELGGDQASAAELARVLVSMAATAAGMSNEHRAQFAGAVATKVLDGAAPAVALTRIEELLAVPALQITAKAGNLLTDHATLFASCRVLTDVRPIFADDGTRIEAALVTHQLRLTVDDGGANPRDLFIALDASDLREIRSAIDRALQKQVALEAFAKTAGTMVVAQEDS